MDEGRKKTISEISNVRMQLRSGNNIKCKCPITIVSRNIRTRIREKEKRTHSKILFLFSFKKMYRLLNGGKEAEKEKGKEGGEERKNTAAQRRIFQLTYEK